MFDFFDLHCDTLTKCMDKNIDIYDNLNQNNLKQLLKYSNPCQIFAVFTDDVWLGQANSYAKRAIEYYNKQKALFSDFLTDFSKTSVPDKVNAILSIEGAEPIESLEDIEFFYSKGIRLITLTWNRVNIMGSGALSGSDAPLTDFGKKAIRLMNRKNIVIDVSHLNEAGFKDVEKFSDKPFVATHSNCAEVCGHKRNLKDWQIKAIKNAGGLIGVNLYPPFLTDKENAEIDDILKHIAHFLDMDCEDNISLGCDFDGISYTPIGINGCCDMDFVYDKVKNEFGKIVADKMFFCNADKFWKMVYEV